MPNILVVETVRLEDWLYALGCHKTTCHGLICIWRPPNNLPSFTAPNPDRVQFIPLDQMVRLGDVISEIMKKGGIGYP